MAALAPLSMSQTKDELLKHLEMAPETYTMMAKETDRVYKWLTSERLHLKKNCQREPPYDWSDIVEKSKDEAMERIAQSSDPHTSYYWNLAQPTNGCPNWIARWFLYHKFRYRYGRNKTSVKTEDRKHSYHHNGSKHYRQNHQPAASPKNDGYYNREATYHQDRTMASASSIPADDYAAAANTNGCDKTSYTYIYENNKVNKYEQQGQNDIQGTNTYYDPVRDARIFN